MLANRRYDECTALLAELRKQFPGDDEILKLQKTVLEDQRKQRRAQSVAEARSLLAARRYDDCTSLLNSILKEFPGDEEVLQLQKNVLDDQRKEQRSQSIAEARSLFAARRHDACTTLLNSILKEFPGDEETLQLQKNVLDDQRKQRMLDSLSEARNLLAAKRYDDCIERLTISSERISRRNRCFEVARNRPGRESGTAAAARRGESQKIAGSPAIR